MGGRIIEMTILEPKVGVISLVYKKDHILLLDKRLFVEVGVSSSNNLEKAL